MANNMLIDFLRESLQRLFQKSPKYFRIWGYISMTAALVTGLPGLLQELGINLPDWAAVLQNKVIGWASTIAFLIAKLTVQSTPVAMTPGGEVLKKTNEEKLPFTAANEQKAANKADNLPTSDVSEKL